MSLLRRVFRLLLGFRRLGRFGRRFLFGLRLRRSRLFLCFLVFRGGLLVSFSFLYTVWMCWGGMMKGWYDEWGSYEFSSVLF